MKTIKTKALAYMRVSGKGQIHGDGFNRQRDTIQNYAKTNKLEIIKWFKEEGISGSKEVRPALAKLMLLLEENNNINAVIIEKCDRLARDLMVQEAIINDFSKIGCELISATEGDLLKNDPTRILVRQILGAISQYEKEMIVLKLRAARERQKLKHGKCEGRKNYKESKPEIINIIKRMRKKNKRKRSIPFKEIAEFLNQSGHRTLTGKKFTETNLKSIMFRLKLKT